MREKLIRDERSQHYQSSGALESSRRRTFLKGVGAIGGVAASTFTVPVVGADHAHTVTVGEDETFPHYNRARTGNNKGGLELAQGDANADTSGVIEAVVESLAGEGHAVYRAQVGVLFDVEGDSSQSADIVTSGSIKAKLRAIGDGNSAKVMIRQIVTDITDGQKAKQGVFFAKASDVLSNTVNTEYSNWISTQLEPGHSYWTDTKLVARIDVKATDVRLLPKADALNGSRGASVDEIRIDF